jgi:hypothetical protein
MICSKQPVLNVRPQKLGITERIAIVLQRHPPDRFYISMRWCVLPELQVSISLNPAATNAPQRIGPGSFKFWRPSEIR